MKRIADLIATTLSTAGIDVSSLTRAYESLKGARADASRFQQLLNLKKIVELQTKSADLSHTALEALDLTITGLDLGDLELRRALRAGPRYPHLTPATYTADLMRESLYKIISSCGWKYDEYYIIDSDCINTPVYLEGLDGSSVRFELIYYDDYACLSIGEADGAYYLALHDRNAEGYISWPGYVYWTHMGENPESIDQKLSMAVEMGLIKQENGSWASLQATLTTLSARESSYALLDDLCSAAYTNATVPITTVNAIVDLYGESEVVSFVKSMVAGYNELDSTSVLTIVGSALDNMVGNAGDDGKTFEPKDNPGFMDDLVGVVASIVITVLIVIVSIFLKGVGIILMGILNIVTQLLPKILDKIDQTDFDVVKVNTLPCWNIVGPPGVWTPQSTWLTSALDDRLAVEGMVFMPMSSFWKTVTSNVTTEGDIMLDLYPMARSVGILIYPKANGAYPYQWVIPLLSLPSDDIGTSVTPLPPWNPDSFFVITGGHLYCSVFPRPYLAEAVTDDNPWPANLDDISWTTYSTTSLRYSIIYSLIMAGWDLGRSAEWMNEWDLDFTHNVDLGEVGTWTSFSDCFNTGYSTIETWVRNSFASYSPAKQASTGITNGFLVDLSTMIFFYLLPFIFHKLRSAGEISTWSSLQDADISDLYDVLTLSLPCLQLGIGFLSWLERDSWYALYQSDWGLTPIPRVSEENCGKLIQLWADEIGPGIPAYDACVIWPTISARSVIRGLVMTAATIAVVGASVFIAKRAMKRRAVPRLALREKQFAEAQEALAQNPSSAKAKKQLYKANKRLTKAWKKAGRAGLTMYNGFDTGSSATSSTLKDSVVSQICSSDSTDSNSGEQYCFDQMILLISGNVMSNPE